MPRPGVNLTEALPLHESQVPDSTSGLGGFIRSAQRGTAAEALRGAADRVPLDSLLGDAERFAEKLTDTLRGTSRIHERIACRAGCGWCCHVQVVVSAAEAIRVAAFLRA